MEIKKITAARLQKTNRVICFVFVFLLLVLKLNAQSISFSSGISIPSGLYGSQDFTQKDCGIAKTGYTLNIIFENNRKNRVINPILQYTFNSNPMDQDAIEKYIGVLSPNFLGLQTYKPWSQHLLLTGIKANYYFNNFSLFTKFSGGMGWISSFGYSYYDTATFPGIDIIKRKVATVNSLVLNVGIGGNVMLQENIALNFGYDLFYAKANFGKPAYVDAGGNQIGLSETYSPTFQTASIYLGLTFNLRRNYLKNKIPE
jgi:hypothetical protein